jgi:hypothetical protein
MTLQAIANELNKQGHTTRRGKPWNPVQVARMLERAEAGLPVPRNGRNNPSGAEGELTS